MRAIGTQVKNILVILSLLIFAAVASAQAPQGNQGAGNGKNNAMAGPRRHMATILFAGLGGAVLGLSTLSFYGRPQDKLSNIAMGFAMGVFAGTCFVTYKAINTPSDFYGDMGSDRPRYDLMADLRPRVETYTTVLTPQWTFNF